MVTGCVQSEYHKGTRIPKCAPKAHESQRRIYYLDAGRALLLSPVADFGRAGSERDGPP